MSRFLRFVVEETLEGRGDELKESVIGVRVFDKLPSYDTRTDSTVRVEASKLRSRLARYYRETGTSDSLVLSIPKGTYLPTFQPSSGEVGDSQVPVEIATPPRPSTVAPREILAWVAVVALVLLLWLPSPKVAAETARSTTVRFDVTGPAGTFAGPVEETGPAVMSLDRSVIAFVLADASGGRSIWTRRLEERRARRVEGTDGAAFPFWSPDGRSLGFFAAGWLRRVDLDTGLVGKLAPAVSGRGGTWNRFGSIVFSPDEASALLRVAAAGGPVSAASSREADEIAQNQPAFLPNGRDFLYMRTLRSGVRQVMRASLSGGSAVAIAAADSGSAVLPSGDLVYLRGSDLVARNLQFSQPIRTLARNVAAARGIGDFAAVSGALMTRSSGENAWVVEIRDR